MSPAIQVRSQKRRNDEAQEAEVFIFMHFSLSFYIGLEIIHKEIGSRCYR